MHNTNPRPNLMRARPLTHRRHSHCHRQTQAGFSIVELMVAMTISIILLTGTAGLFISNKRIYREQDESAILQENGRFAMQVLYDNIRMAGYFGCSDNTLNIKNNISSNLSNYSQLYDLRYPVEGVSKTGSTTITWQPSGSDQAIADIKNGTDAITVRYFRGASYRLTEDMPYQDAAIKVDRNATLGAREVLGISNCAGGDVFISSGQGASGQSKTLSHAAGTNTSNKLNRTYNEGAEVARFISRRFYIDVDNDGVPWLAYTGTDDSDLYEQVKLIDGVEDMRLLYGEDTNSDQIADEFRAAGDVANWENVVSVRGSLLLRTPEENPDVENNQTYHLLDKTITAPGDGYRRRVFTTTILIRNRDT